MSAWMCADAHFDLLATAWLQQVDPEANPQDVGQCLARDNAASIRARYEDRHGDAREAEAQAEAYQYRKWEGNIDPDMLAKQIACFEYQSCETGDWEKRPSYVGCRKLTAALGVEFDGHDRFNVYPWGVDDHAVELAA